MLKKRDRLTAKDIESLSLGKSVFGTLLSLRFVGSSRRRLSVTVSKKVAHSAVERARIRRRVYAAAEKPLQSVKHPAFLLIMPKKECATAPFEDLVRDIETVFSRARLLG